MQEEQRRMYELEYPAPVVKDDSTQGSGPTMIVAMNGYADAGQAVEASADHLKAALENRQLASFNNDELVDYRSRRPAVTIDHDRTVEIENVDLGIKVLRDNSGKPFLLLSGPEPDLRWEAFTDAVVNLVEKFDIQNTIMLYAAPMPVPHTRPTVVTAHGNSPELLNSMVRIESTMMVPGAAALYLERALDKKGRQVAGYTAHVPHYLASSPYPSATLHLLDSVASAVDLNIPLGSLEADVDRVNQQLEEQVTDSDEIAGVVHQLEEQYDAYMERYRKRHPQAIMPGEEHMPTGEEIGADFEAFLAGLDENPEILSEDIDDREDNFGKDGDSDDEDSGKDMGDDV
ncbi:PAC2 family protein [Corynebacterium sp. YSMAA5_1_F9]|uniref:PAC2 family protein n=1 Tax=unclassified Corynebacterium TaxID=2624378 RepID=UPI0038D24902